MRSRAEKTRKKKDTSNNASDVSGSPKKRLHRRRQRISLPNPPKQNPQIAHSSLPQSVSSHICDSAVITADGALPTSCSDQQRSLSTPEQTRPRSAEKHIKSRRGVRRARRAQCFPGCGPSRAMSRAWPIRRTRTPSSGPAQR